MGGGRRRQARRAELSKHGGSGGEAVHEGRYHKGEEGGQRSGTGHVREFHRRYQAVEASGKEEGRDRGRGGDELEGQERESARGAEGMTSSRSFRLPFPTVEEANLPPDDALGWQLT